MKKIVVFFSLFAFLIFGISLSCLFASSLKPEGGGENPDWLKRTNFAIEIESDEEPKYFLETVQPLLGTEDDDVILFNQMRVSSVNRRPILNIGFGARTIFHERYLLGINAFYDHQDLHQHKRGGIGFEAIDDYGLESRLNTYFGISDERVVKDEGGNEYIEKVADGLDWEMGMPFPHMPYLRLYGGGYWYDFEHFKNKVGWKARLEFNPLRYSRLNLEMFNDTKRDDIGYRFEGAITLAFSSFSLTDIINDLRSSKYDHAKIDLGKKTLDRVVRDFDITVIKSIKSKATGLTVEGGRGSG